MNTQLSLPVVKGFSNATALHVALTEPYQPFPRAADIQSVICLFAMWDENAFDTSKSHPPALERLEATSIEHVETAKLYDVDFRGRPHGKARLKRMPPFEQNQRKWESNKYGSVTYCVSETPFVNAMQRAHIQSMFPIDEWAFADIAKIVLRGKRRAPFRSIVVLIRDAIQSSQLSSFVMLSRAK